VRILICATRQTPCRKRVYQPIALICYLSESTTCTINIFVTVPTRINNISMFYMHFWLLLHSLPASTWTATLPTIFQVRKSQYCISVKLRQSLSQLRLVDQWPAILTLTSVICLSVSLCKAPCRVSVTAFLTTSFFKLMIIWHYTDITRLWKQKLLNSVI